MDQLKNCQYCGETIEKTKNKSWTQYKKRKYCSRQCSNNGRSQKVKVKCLNCGATLKRSPSHVSDQNYCSQKCVKDHNRVECECDACGKVFERRRCNLINSRTGEQYKNTYCSKECSDERRRKDSKPDQGRRHPKDREWKQKVLKKDGYECRICGTDRDLEAHHIQSVNEAPELRHDVDNGMCVCHDCHYYKIHGGSPSMKHGRYAKPHPDGPFQLVFAL